jgi:branched-chain amino acid aminotransferase
VSELAQAEAALAGPGFEQGAAFAYGQYVPIEEAQVSILDTGFSRSDVTYDVVAVWGGAFFRLQDHLERFERSCRELRLTLKHDRDEIASILIELVRLTGLRAAYVETICTRGVDRAGVRDPRMFENQFFAYAIPYVWLLDPRNDPTGMDTVIARTVRRIPSTSVDPTVKNFHWGDLIRGLYEAYDRGARYPILLDHDGNVTEGAGYNVFALIDGRLLTPSSGTLAGITRRTILELAEREGIPAESVPLSEEAFRSGTELFATSTAGGVMPIVSLDGEAVGDGAAGPVTRRLRELYWQSHNDPRYITPVDYAARRR